MEKTREVTELFDDIMRMAREISLEREILARKTDALMFLNRIMTRAVESLNPVSILAGAREDLNMVLPVRSLQGIFWQHSAKSSVEAEVFLSFHEETDVQDQWLELLFAKVEELTSCQVSGYQLTYLMDPDGEAAADLGPDNDRLILLPLKAGGEHFGCLALLSGEPVRLGRDQSQVLVSAANHLGLALKNALLFRETKIRADYDALTRIYNRHYFDGRLSEEVQRQRRYQYDLSLLLLDLDHFKRINDVFGHQAGDMVLKEVGQVLLDGMRATDFAARYGGEEFVIILPHISKDQAARTAERLRRKVASRVFRHGGKDLRVTASVGVASLSSGSLETGAELLRRADEALYRAKAEGRDRVVVHGEAESAERERAGEM
jgi:diguanylate cyclase (GGDEF)-like protein